MCRVPAQPSAEIVRVECAKCRRECDLPAARATLCGDRACRVREMQASVRFAGCARNPLRRSCVSSARNAGESAICRLPAQPSADRACRVEIVRVECAKCRRECDLPAARTTLCGDRACQVREMQARVRFAGRPRNPLRRSCVSSARNAGESAIRRAPAQPSAEIVRVECAKCRRECDLPGARTTLCGDRACRVREMQARVRFAGCARNPLRRSCVSSARNAGESAICRLRAQPSAEIVRVKCAKYRRECDLPAVRATLCGDRVCRVREMQARVRFAGCARNPLRRSRVSSARNAGESAICRLCAQPSAEIVRVDSHAKTLADNRQWKPACWLPLSRWKASALATIIDRAPSTPPSWPRWSPPCLRSGQRSESLPDAGCHLDVHVVTNCMSHTMNSSLQILCGRRFAEARQV